MRPSEEVKKEIVRQWLARAEQNMRAGEAVLVTESPFLYPTCFHAQQAAEKYLKALLTWHQIDFPKTHDIEQLLDLVKEVDAENASSLRDATLLTPYGVEIQYPGDQTAPNLEEAREAVGLARRVSDAVMDRLGKI